MILSHNVPVVLFLTVQKMYEKSYTPTDVVSFGGQMAALKTQIIFKQGVKSLLF